MKVYFIRHGQSEGNRQKRHCGWTATPLSELGHQQARNANAYLKDIPFDRIYCSDLLRARQTCEDALPGSQPILSDKIREISVGTLAGMLYDECAATLGEPYIRGERMQDFSLFGGENQQQMHERVQSFIHDLEQLEGMENVAVFGHEGTVHQMINYVFGHDVTLQHLRIANASATVFSYENGIWTLLAFSYTGTLSF